jgi:hypothetical protein
MLQCSKRLLRAFIRRSSLDSGRSQGRSFFMSVQLDIAISTKTNGTFSHPNGAGHVQRAVGAVPTAQDVPSSPLKRHTVMGQDVTPIRTSLIRTSHRLCLSHLPWLGVCGGGIC